MLNTPGNVKLSSSSSSSSSLLLILYTDIKILTTPRANQLANQKVEKVNSRVKDPSNKRAAKKQRNKNNNQQHNNTKVIHSLVEKGLKNLQCQARMRNHLLMGVMTVSSHRKPKQS